MADHEPVIPENPIQRANRQNRAACYAYGRFDENPIKYVPLTQFIALVTERGVDTEGFRSLYNELLAAKTAVSEDQPSTKVSRGQAWLHRTGDPTRTLTVVRVDKPLIAGRDDMTFVGLQTVSGKPKRMLVSQLRAYYRRADLPTPAVSEDQTTPRVWRKGDEVRDKDGDAWAFDGQAWRHDGGDPFSWSVITERYGPLSEVLADSEGKAS